uniref:Uncharacterized protein n=1 Tax=Cacopsylla melanoneura TaxID=428564 RepID=A0A8D9BNP4_9HEMI
MLRLLRYKFFKTLKNNGQKLDPVLIGEFFYSPKSLKLLLFPLKLGQRFCLAPPHISVLCLVSCHSFLSHIFYHAVSSSVSPFISLSCKLKYVFLVNPPLFFFFFFFQPWECFAAEKGGVFY